MPEDNRQPATFPYPNTTPPSSPPPQMPAPPYQSPYNPGPVMPDQAELASHYIKPRKPWVLPVIFIVFVAIIGTAATFGLRAYKNNPATIFDQALSKSLDTKQVKESVTSATNASTIIFDINDVKKPRISTLTTQSLGANTYIKGYGTLQNTYLSYASSPNSDTNTPTALLDQWVQVRDTGKLPAGATLNPLITTIDPRYQLLSLWVFGNFTGKDRSTLINLAKSSKLYQISAKNTSSDTLNGRAVLIYNISIDNKKLAAYESKVGQVYGIPASDVSAATKLLGNTISMKIYVQKDTHQVVRVDTTNDGVVSTATYDYSAQALPNEPNPGFTYNDYLQQLGS